MAEEADEISYEELVDRLGSPREWVNAQLDIMGGEAYENKIASLKKKRKVLTLIITAVALLIASVAIYFARPMREAAGSRAITVIR